jgi:hypothetical protein
VSFSFGGEATVFGKATSLDTHEAAFVGRLIVSVVFHTHTLSEFIESQYLSKLFTRVLAATFKMKEGAAASKKVRTIALPRALITMKVYQVSATNHPSTALP